MFLQLLIRADASPQIGTGHVMRCLALAQAWIQEGGKAIALMRETTPALESRLTDESISVVHLNSIVGSKEDALETVQTAKKAGATWVVIDGYHFDAEYQRLLKENDLRLLVLDDYGHAKYYWADIVLNQNISASTSLYPHRESYTQLLLGPKFVLLRREFWGWHGWRRQAPESARKILITLGGSDPDNVTLKVIKSLQKLQINDLQVVVVVGASNPHLEVLQATVANYRYPIHLESNATNMPELMAWADIAIAGGGSTSWELAFMGLPTLTLILAENQQAIAEKLDELKIAINLGWHENVSANKLLQSLNYLLSYSEKYIEISQTGQNLVDGNGSFQVTKILTA